MNPRLVAAMEREDIPGLKRLINARSDLEARNDHGETPLIWAIKNGSPHVLQTLIDGKADVTAKDARHGKSALIWAVSIPCFDSIRILLDADKDIEAIDDNGSTALLAGNFHCRRP